MGEHADEHADLSGLAELHVERETRYKRLRKLYADYPSRILIEEIIRCGKRINDCVSDNKFPAFDIAVKLYNDGNYTPPSAKQRKSLINILAAYRTFR